ncbi:MAG: hypothetical protein FD137_993 [Spirochaetes bacterium]|nr:MAG: hypothetical protein FD137_993 [Spirochaetota bacterium]
MKKHDQSARKTLSWAGSKAGDGIEGIGLSGLGTNPGASGKDMYKLNKIRHKLDDSGYVDSAVTRIASFLTNTLDKKENHER